MNLPILVSTLTTLLYVSVVIAEPTKIIIYSAYTEKNILDPSLVIAQRYTGNCWTRSVANPNRTDAWRCQANNMVLDPCYEDDTSLACVISPWSHKAAILELSSPLYKNKSRKVDTAGQPWAMELANGKRCLFLSGTSAVINKERINYACDNYNYNIIGNVDRSSTTWQANLYDYSNKSVDKVAVVTAWF